MSWASGSGRNANSDSGAVSSMQSQHTPHHSTDSEQIQNRSKAYHRRDDRRAQASPVSEFDFLCIVAYNLGSYNIGC
jgi:hypothetical protein